MKYLIIITISIFSLHTAGQTLQLHYDLRHTFDPGRNPSNYPTLYFEYFKDIDSGKSFIKPGAFLFKSQADFTGTKTAIGKYYMQVSQDVRFWEPKVFLSLQYSGGLGVTDPPQYSYYIYGAYAVGASYPFRLGSAYLSTVLYYRYVPYSKPSNDLLYTLYFYRSLWNYKAEFAGDFSIWTENKDHGDAITRNLRGKRFYFFAEPQLWLNLSKCFSVGSKINMYYHVLTGDNRVQVYPTIAARLKL